MSKEKKSNKKVGDVKIAQLFIIDLEAIKKQPEYLHSVSFEEMIVQPLKNVGFEVYLSTRIVLGVPESMLVVGSLRMSHKDCVYNLINDIYGSHLPVSSGPAWL